MSFDDAQLHDLLSSYARPNRVPGAAAGVLVGGTAAVAAYGIARLDIGEPVTVQTSFRVSSSTKPLTATVAALLAADGVVAFDEPITRHVPRLRLADREAQETITLRMLLSHSSGLDCDLPKDLSVYGDGDDALERWTSELDGLEQVARPGELWAYSSAGYSLVAAALAHAADTTFEDLVRELVFTPLGMEDSALVYGERVPRRAARGHLPREGDSEYDVVPPVAFPRVRMPSGGLVTSAADLLRLGTFHLENPVFATLRDPEVDAIGPCWGCGWSLEELGGATLVSQLGSFGGFHSLLALVPEHEVAMAILTNSDSGMAVCRGLVREVLEGHCGLRWTAPETVEHPDVGRFAGYYRQANLSMDVEACGDRLRVAQRHRDPQGVEHPWAVFEGRPIGDTRFFADDADFPRFDFPKEDVARVGGRIFRRAARV
jgi:CubicO group peptidase (beta-lactamase class C family)